MTTTSVNFKGLEIEVDYSFTPGIVTAWDEPAEPDEVEIEDVRIGEESVWAWVDAADWWEELDAVILKDATGYRMAA